MRLRPALCTLHMDRQNRALSLHRTHQIYFNCLYSSLNSQHKTERKTQASNKCAHICETKLPESGQDCASAAKTRKCSTQIHPRPHIKYKRQEKLIRQDKRSVKPLPPKQE